MKGRINSTLWLVIFINGIAMIAILALGMAAGGWAHSGDVRDVISNPSGGTRLIIASVLFEPQMPTSGQPPVAVTTTQPSLTASPTPIPPCSANQIA